MKKILFTLAMMLMAIGANAQMKIVTGHPDLRAKITRCVASEKTVFIDLVFYNEGSDDMFFGLQSMNVVCYDDDANSYSNNDFKLAIGKEELKGFSRKAPFPAQTSLKARFVINNVSESATEFSRIDIEREFKIYDAKNTIVDWSEYKPMKFYNIPITRE